MTKLQERREGKFTRQQLTELIGMKPQALRHYEQGYRKIDGAEIKTLAKLAKALNCKISDLVEDEETVKLLLSLNQ